LDTKRSKATENKPPEWYESPEWTLVIVGCITFLIIGWQSYETRRSADAGKEASEAAKTGADAALLTAQALIASERPWFVTSVESCEDNSDLWRVRVANKGRTPGHLNAMFSEYIFGL
jgi:hypothetical protein